MPDSYELKGKAFIDKDGKKHGFVPSICWWTNLEIKKRYEDLILYKQYNSEEYPKYDNYDAINVSKTSDIPIDYDGVMGVAISFLDKYNPNQFEIIGLLIDSYGDGLVQGTPTYVDEKHKHSICAVLHGKRQFAKILIKRR
jgi:hypothetical protein